MSSSTKLTAGQTFPAISVPNLKGGELSPAAESGWRMVVVYRGKHCPLCKRYLKTLDGMLNDFTAAGVTVSAVSADPKEKAEADVKEHGWHFPVGYNLSMEQMRELGLYISAPRSPEETDRPFPEPGLFVINPAGKVQIIDISNAPFSRPDLAGVLAGIKLIQDRQYPIRGTLA